MFSPSANGAAPSTVRSSRRRPRPSPDATTIQPRAKRQRNTLNDQTFTAPDGSSEMQEVNKSSGVATRRGLRGSTPTNTRELTVRGKNPLAAERPSKGDGSTILTANETYTVSKLPALPDRLQGNAIARQHGYISTETGYALALTPSHALVWPYAINNPSPETFTFALPYPSKHASDPLPLGSLVSPSAASPEPGLVVVMPKTGRITYWESIASAATLDLIQQQRNGIESAVPDMSSKETVVQLLNAESAGFILAFSSGRLAYMSVRDGQGRPVITVQTLRGSGGYSSGGFFGSLRNALVAPTLGDIAAVRAGRSTKVGERDVVVATKKGKIQSWEMQRSGHNSLQAEADTRESIVLAIKQSNSDCEDLLLESFEIVDFTFAPQSLKQSTMVRDQDNTVHLLILTSMTDRIKSYYSLVEVILGPDSLQVGTVRPITTYTTPISHLATSKPRIYLPNPALVAFVVFDRAVVILSMARHSDSPEAQLMSDSHLLPKGFEDVVDFREGLDVEIVGSGAEEPHGPVHGTEDAKSRRYRAKVPATVLLVKGGGVIRISAQDVQKLASNKAPRVTAKSKLDQAVFYGTMPQNPLSFIGRVEQEFSAAEIGEAALELSHEILSSTTPHIASVTASVDKNLRKRAAALRDLALHLKRLNVDLDRVTRWRLLWDAEKLAGATRVWNSYDVQLQEKPVGSKRGLLTDLVEYIHENYKSEPVEEAGELDRVRHWFINDVWRLEIAVPWAHQVVKYTYNDGSKDPQSLLTLISEADDLVIGALEGAFEFRTANLDLYGLDKEVLRHGILTGGYEDLPEIWTSTMFITDNLLKQVNVAREAVKKHWMKEYDGDDKPNESLVKKVALENPRVVDLCCRSTEERYRWMLSHDDPKVQDQGIQLKSAHLNVREALIAKLIELNFFHEAIALAERHKVMPTLVFVYAQFNSTRQAILADPTSSEEAKEDAKADIAALQKRASTYYTQFGEDWATATYKYFIQIGELSSLLDEGEENRHYLTQFLRSRPDFAKVAWIHEVIVEKDFDRASKDLLDEAIIRERHNQSKKIELSIGKLARLAGRQYSQESGLIIPDGGQLELKTANNQLALCDIQEKVYLHVLPSSRGAIDEKAALQLVLEDFGNSQKLEDTNVLASLVEQNLESLLQQRVMDVASLIDLLTLMGRVESDNEEDEVNGDIDGEEYYLALRALSLSEYKDDERSLLERVIWRRCFIRDDWKDLNNTALKDDQLVQDQVGRTALYSTLRACYKNGLFEKPSTLKAVSPQEALGACTEPDTLGRRFRDADDEVKSKLAADMQSEDEVLQTYIEKCRLEKWYQGALELAKSSVQEEANEETENGQHMKDIGMELAKIEYNIARKTEDSAADLALSEAKSTPPLNGSVRGLRSSKIPRPS